MRERDGTAFDDDVVIWEGGSHGGHETVVRSA